MRHVVQFKAHMVQRRRDAGGPLRAKAILSRSEARMDFAVPCRGRRRSPNRPGMPSWTPDMAIGNRYGLSVVTETAGVPLEYENDAFCSQR